MRVDLLVTDRPITPSGTGRAAPQVWCTGAPADGGRTRSAIQVRPGTPVLPKLLRTNLSAVDPRGAQQHHWCSGARPQPVGTAPTMLVTWTPIPGSDPWLTASPKAKTPPSDPMSQ